MDELAALLEKLEGEVAALEAAVRGREADEARQLEAHEVRLDAAEQRLTRARAQLGTDSAALTLLDERRRDLLKRIESWRGELWRLGHASAAVALVVAALIPLPVVGTWLGTGWSLGLAATQAVLFTCAFVLIPEKR